MPATRRAAAAAQAEAAAAAAGATPADAAALGADECDAGTPSAPFTHLLIVALVLLPLAVQVPVNLNIVALPVLTIFAGSWRSVKISGPPGEVMTQKDAMQFPLIGRRGPALRGTASRVASCLSLCFIIFASLSCRFVVYKIS